MTICHSCLRGFPCSSNKGMSLEVSCSNHLHTEAGSWGPGRLLSLAQGSLALSLNPFWYNSPSLPLAHATKKPTNGLNSRKILLKGAQEWYVQNIQLFFCYFHNSCFKRYPRSDSLISHGKLVCAECFHEVPHLAQYPGCVTDRFPLLVAEWISKKVQFS